MSRPPKHPEDKAMAARWGISERTAHKLRNVPEHELPLFVGMAKKASRAQKTRKALVTGRTA